MYSGEHCGDGFLVFLSDFSSGFLFSEPCQPGSWSRTGYQPCDLCPLNFYQDDSTAVACKECDPDKVTTNPGAQSDAECVVLAGIKLHQ